MIITAKNQNIKLKINQPPKSTLPNSWDDMVAAYGQGYMYPPPTGQTTSYRVGDDAWVEQNIFAAARAAQKLKVFNTLVDFVTLQNNNVFGNKNRFTDTAGGQEYGTGSNGSVANYIIDHYTGLGIYYYNGGGTLLWNDEIDDAVNLTYNGWSDYFLPSTNQYRSILQFISAGVLNYPPFNYSTTTYIRTSTSTSADYVLAFRPWGSNLNNYIEYRQAKSNTGMRAPYFMRKHF